MRGVGGRRKLAVAAEPLGGVGSGGWPTQLCLYKDSWEFNAERGRMKRKVAPKSKPRRVGGGGSGSRFVVAQAVMTKAQKSGRARHRHPLSLSQVALGKARIVLPAPELLRGTYIT